MTEQEEIRDWVFAMLRPICFSDEHCEAYVSDLFRGLSKRGVVLRVDRGLPEILSNYKSPCANGFLTWVEPLVEKPVLKKDWKNILMPVCE